MRSKRDAVEYPGHGNGIGGTPVTPESSRAVDSEEWAWMVAEDPAFYLTKSGRGPENRGG